MRSVLPVTFVALTAVVAAQAPPSALSHVSRAAEYIRQHESQIMSLVGEERQTQRLVRANGSIAEERVLVSDMIFVKVGNRPYVFRDVASVDGKPVRNREGRLEKLFSAGSRTALQQARAIVEESSRHDLNFERFRQLSPVLLPLTIIAGTIDRYRFSVDGDVVVLEEVASPTLYQSRAGGPLRDMPLSGRLTIDASTGALRSGTIVVHGETVEATVDATYAEDAVSKIFAPVRVSEVYRRVAKPKDEHLEVATVFLNVRRFLAKVDEQVALPD